MFYGFSIIMFGIIFLLNKNINEPVFNSHLEYILTNIVIFVVASILTGGFMFYFLIFYFVYKFWIGINKVFLEESISFEYF